MVATDYFNDLHVYNPATMTWFDLSGHALGAPPVPRAQHGFTSTGDKLYVHGGSSYYGELIRPAALKFIFLVLSRVVMRPAALLPWINKWGGHLDEFYVFVMRTQNGSSATVRGTRPRLLLE